MPGFDIRAIPKLPLFSLNSSYYLYDKFTTALAAGAVNGTLAEPVGGARTVTDTNSKLSVTGGLLTIASSGAAQGNPGIWYPAITRSLGKTLLSTINITSASSNSNLAIGVDSDTSGAIVDGFIFTTTSRILSITLAAVGTYASATNYNLAQVLRASGSFLFIKGGAFTNWTLLAAEATPNTATIYPAAVINATVSAFTLNNFRVPKQAYIPVPLQSDGMSADTTDGLGNPENNGVVGTVYEDFGTWGVSGGVRSCSVLGGATGSSVLATSSKNVHIETNVVRSAGFAGISARREDSSNYIRCTHDGTNVVVTQVIAGTPTVLSTTAVAYSAGATLKFDLSGTSYRAYYNNTAGGTGTVTDTESTKHGLITSGTANTFDNLVIWAKGNENQYNGLNNL